VQNWLKDICATPEFAAFIEQDVDPDDRRQNVYRSSAPTVGQRIMPVEEACLALMAEKFLQAAIPADFYDAALQDLFRAARARLAEYERLPRPNRKRVKDYIRRIAIESRGQVLVEQRVPYEVLGPLSRAVLEGRRVVCRYRAQPRELHPYGIVLRSPKIYLLAVDDHVLRKRRPEELTPALFLCSQIEDAEVSERPNLVPAGFNADAFVEEGGLDGDAADWGLPSRRFTLELRIHLNETNLLTDLEAFPLSPEQTLVKEKGTSNHLLTAPRMHGTHQLIEWILGRVEDIEVLAPSSLRTYIKQRLEATLARYT
jgi:predicted DNA-binding transcriptional regulator YafY